MPFTIDTTELVLASSRLSYARIGLASFMRSAVQAVADESVNELHSQAPYDGAANNGVIPGEEGHLDESFSADAVSASSMGATTDVKTSEPIKFQYVTQGTASPILPVVQRALWWPGAAHPFSRVRGQAANPFHVPIAADINARVGEIIAPALDAWLVSLEL